LDRRKQYRKAKRKAEAEAIRIGMEEMYDAEAELMAYGEEMDGMEEDFAESILSEPVEYTEDYFETNASPTATNSTLSTPPDSRSQP
jgi:hypothetical protein